MLKCHLGKIRTSINFWGCHKLFHHQRNGFQFPYAGTQLLYLTTSRIIYVYRKMPIFWLPYLMTAIKLRHWISVSPSQIIDFVLTSKRCPLPLLALIECIGSIFFTGWVAFHNLSSFSENWQFLQSWNLSFLWFLKLRSHGNIFQSLFCKLLNWL